MDSSGSAPARPGGRVRRSMALAVLMLLGLGALGVALGRYGSGSAALPPDIVLIVWDTCRGDRVTVNGYPPMTTPRLLAFAADGVTFRRCYTPAPWTPPAHGSLFTGLLPRDHGLREGMGERITRSVPLLAESLARAGYETVCVSANPLVSPATGLTAGFEREFPCYRTEDGSVTGEAVREQVRAWLRFRRRDGREDRPFFLFINLMETHLPLAGTGRQVKELFGESAVDGAMKASRRVGDLEAKAHLMGRMRIPDAVIEDLGRAYAGAVKRDDAYTGGILDALEESGRLERAFVAVCSDHGENLGEHGELNHALSVYDPVLHVPMVVRWPGRLDGGRVEDAQVRLHDLYATIMEFAELPVPPGAGGDSLSLTATPLEPRLLVAEFGPMPRSMVEARAALAGAPAGIFEKFLHTYRAVQEVEGNRVWKLITVVEGAGSRGEFVVREELYDLVADPRELHDLLAREPAEEILSVARRLRAAGAPTEGPSSPPGDADPEGALGTEER